MRADLIVISGEREDESFDLITGVLQQLGTVTAVTPNIEGSGNHNYGTIGPDKTPVVTLPGDPISAYISAELFIRPMIRSMMGLRDLHRPVIKTKLTNDVLSEAGVHSFIRAVFPSEADKSKVTAIENQSDLVGLSDAHGLIVIPEDLTNVKAGSEVDLLLLERRFN